MTTTVLARLRTKRLVACPAGGRRESTVSDREHVQAARELRLAAALLDERGNARGSFRDRAGRCCAVGALVVANGGKVSWFGDKVRRMAGVDGLAVLDAVVRRLGWPGIARWNDNTPGDEIAATLRAIAGALVAGAAAPSHAANPYRYGQAEYAAWSHARAAK